MSTNKSNDAVLMMFLPHANIESFVWLSLEIFYVGQNNLFDIVNRKKCVLFCLTQDKQSNMFYMLATAFLRPQSTQGN